MVNPKLGTKRVCRKCSAPFYDLNKDPMTCPKCGKTFDVQEFSSKYVKTSGRGQKVEAPVEEVFDLEMEDEDDALGGDDDIIEADIEEDE